MLTAILIILAANVGSGHGKETAIQNASSLGKAISKSKIRHSNADYLRNHVIRTKSPPPDYQFYHFKMSELVPEGRNPRRRQQVKKSLVPFLLGLGPIFTAMAALFAFKGFWAGMTALFVSKAVALKVFAQSKRKCDHDSDEHDDYEDHDQYHERHHPQKFNRHVPYFTNHEHVSHGENSKPIVIYFNANGRNENSGHRFLEPPPTDEHHNPELWESWKIEDHVFKDQTSENLLPFKDPQLNKNDIYQQENETF